MGFELVTGFIGHLKLATTSNYSSSWVYSLQFTGYYVYGVTIDIFGLVTEFIDLSQLPLQLQLPLELSLFHSLQFTTAST
jgi:hypothetical protein